jgi:hypothetical protein
MPLSTIPGNVWRQDGMDRIAIDKKIMHGKIDINENESALTNVKNPSYIRYAA